MITKKSKIYIAGHKGMVGSSCWRKLHSNGFDNLVGRSSDELDLTNQADVTRFLKEEKPDVIINAAAKVGGILANDREPYEFLMNNMMIQNNIISVAHKFEIPKLIFLGSSCIYPKLADQPLREEYLLTGELEPTNQWYAIAKISGVKLIEALRKQYNRDYVSLMPTNLYGPGDNFDLYSSHVLPAMIRKFHEAKINNQQTVTLWGSGKPMREFLHVDDLASAVLFTLQNGVDEHLYNVGTGIDLTIKELAFIVQQITGHKGDIIWDRAKPDGTPRKIMDSSKIRNLGWQPKIKLESGIQSAYEWYLKTYSN